MLMTWMRWRTRTYTDSIFNKQSVVVIPDFEFRMSKSSWNIALTKWNQVWRTTVKSGSLELGLAAWKQLDDRLNSDKLPNAVVAKAINIEYDTLKKAFERAVFN